MGVRATAAAAALAFACLTACGPRDAASSAQTAAGAPADTTPAPPGCEAVDNYISRMPGLERRPPRGVPLSAAWDGADARPACQAAASGHSVNEYASVDSLLGWLRISGWRENTIYSADGPDGTVVGMHNGIMTCIIQGRWDGGDDSDTTAVRSDTLDVTATCAPTIGADTARERPTTPSLSRAAPPAARRGLHRRHRDAQDLVELRILTVHECVAACLERTLPPLSHSTA
jgi:hypothetical protein